MRKKYKIIIIVAVILCLIALCVIFINNRKQKEEAIQFFEEQVSVLVLVDNSYENINEIQEKLQNIEFVGNVRFVSKDEAFENFKNSFNSDLLNDYSSDFFRNEFIITFDIDDVKDFEKLKNVEETINNIDGIDHVESGALNEIISSFETDGVKGVIETKNGYKEVEEQLEKYNNM